MKDTNELIQEKNNWNREEKNNWNREEVIELITSAIYAQNYTIYTYKYPDDTITGIDKESFDKWIEDNL